MTGETPQEPIRGKDVPDCTSSLPLFQWGKPVPRAPFPCDPIVSPEPEKYVVPPALPTSGAPPAIPPLIIDLLSLEAAFTCSDFDGGPIGAPVRMERGEFSLAFSFATVPNITDSQQRYIAAHEEDARRVIDTVPAAAEIAATLKLTLQQATWLNAQLTSGYAALEEQVRAAAASLIDCYWINGQQQLDCPDGSHTGALPSALASSQYHNPVIVPAGEFKSHISQGDADDQATIVARSRLLCVWLNDEQVIDCRDSDAGGFLEEIPVDEEPVGVAPRRRIGRVVIPANSVLSYTSKEEANAEARILGLAQLDCFYINSEVTRVCEPDVVDDDGVPLSVPAISDETPANAFLGEQGNPVFVPAGAVEATTQEEADAQAQALAAAALNCEWGNAEVTADCPSIRLGDFLLSLPSYLEDTVIAAQPAIAESGPSSPRFSVTIEANEVRSPYGRRDADAQALALAEGQLDCLYCNPRIRPTCVPPNMGDPTDPELPLPLTIPPDQLSDASPNFTPGIAAFTICSADAVAAYQIAEVAAVTPPPKPAESDCIYESDAQMFACIREADNPTYGRIHGLFDEEMEFDGEVFQIREELSPYSTPPPRDLFTIHPDNSPDLLELVEVPEDQKYLRLPAGFIQITVGEVPDGKDPKTYANELAVTSGLALLNCYFANEFTVARCEDYFRTPINQKDTFWDGGTFKRRAGAGKPIWDYVPAPAPTPVPTSIIIGAERFASYETPQAVRQDLAAFARSVLVCEFWSRPQEAYCYENHWKTPNKDPYYASTLGGLNNPVNLPQGFAKSQESQAAADAEALQMAKMLRNCLYGSGKKDPILIKCGARLKDCLVIDTGHGQWFNPMANAWEDVPPEYTGGPDNPAIVDPDQFPSYDPCSALYLAFIAALARMQCTYVVPDGEGDGTINIPGRESPSASASDLCPLTLVLSTDTRRVQFISGGLVGNVPPSNLFVGGALWSSVVSSKVYVCARCLSSGKVITSAEIVLRTLPPGAITPTLGSLPTDFVVPLYLVTPDSVHRLWGCSNFNLEPTLALSVAKGSVLCGTYPLDYWWTWRATG